MAYRIGWLVMSITLVAATSGFGAGRPHRMVIVPESDRFTPFSMTIRPGESVEWENDDTDDHTVVSDDAFNTAGNQGVDQVLPGTDSNGGQPGTLTLRFTHPGTFVFYCRFHAHLDESSQPVAPGPDGGIADASGNFGTPMMGVITVQAGGAAAAMRRALP